MKATIGFHNDNGSKVSKTMTSPVTWCTSDRGLVVEVSGTIPSDVRRPFYFSVHLSVPELMKMLWGRMIRDIYFPKEPI